MAPSAVSNLTRAARSISKRLVFAYALDWIVLIVLGLIAFGFTLIEPHFRPFSLIDLSISFPYFAETISVPILAASCVVAPAIIIAGAVFFFVPGPAAWKRMSAGDILKLKIWELNVGWLGLSLAHVTQFLIVQGTKNIVGKPRPNLLDRCQPNLSGIQKYVVGGHGQDISPRWVLVDQKICTQSRSMWVDGFRSFPSGHNSTAFAGMLYLSLYLASKFAVGFPGLPFHKRDIAGAHAERRPPRSQDRLTPAVDNKDSNGTHRQFGYRDEAAGAPTWTLFMVYIPLGVAIYIGASRYFDYYHHGFDVLAGTVIGLLSGWIGFRWYHGPLGRSAGWAWGPRSRDRAFGIGVGTLGYVTDSHRIVGNSGQDDVELGVLQPPTQPQVRTGWQRDQYESLRSSAAEERGTTATSDTIYRVTN